VIREVVFGILFIFSFLLPYSNAQVSVTLAWEKDTIELGDAVNLQLSVLSQSGPIQVESIEGSFLDSIISAFQTVKMQQIDTTKKDDLAFADIEVGQLGDFADNNQNKIFEREELGWKANKLNNEELWQNTFNISIWDPGQIIALPPDVTYSLNGITYSANKIGQAVLFVRPPLDVANMPEDSFSISPIKTIIKEPIKFSDYLIYLYSIGAVFALWLAYILYHRYQRRKEMAPKHEVEIQIPAHRIALDKLHELEQKELWQSGKIKEYQSQLTHVIREYLENRYKVLALEMTTDEIITSLKKIHFETNLVEKLRNILHVADLVKFAKSKPKVSIHQEFMDMARDFVLETKEEEETEEI
jgi:dimeric dUTPase (all-alpha-NTP-PPase superfamily)